MTAAAAFSASIVHDKYSRWCTRFTCHCLCLFCIQIEVAEEHLPSLFSATTNAAVATTWEGRGWRRRRPYGGRKEGADSRRQAILSRSNRMLAWCLCRHLCGDVGTHSNYPLSLYRQAYVGGSSGPVRKEPPWPRHAAKQCDEGSRRSIT